MTKTIELVQEVDATTDIRHYTNTAGDGIAFDGLKHLERFAALVRADERARLMEVAVEPCAWAYHTQCGLIDIITDEEHTREPGDYNVPMFNDDQVAAAVLREREACVEIFSAYQIPIGNSIAGEIACSMTYAALSQIRDEIRARGEG